MKFTRLLKNLDSALQFLPQELFLHRSCCRTRGRLCLGCHRPLPPSLSTNSPSLPATAISGPPATGPGPVTATSGSMAPGSHLPTSTLSGLPATGATAPVATSGTLVTGARPSATTVASTTASATSAPAFTADTGAAVTSGTTVPTTTLAWRGGYVYNRPYNGFNGRPGGVSYARANYNGGNRGSFAGGNHGVSNFAGNHIASNFGGARESNFTANRGSSFNGSQAGINHATYGGFGNNAARSSYNGAANYSNGYRSSAPTQARNYATNAPTPPKLWWK